MLGRPIAHSLSPALHRAAYAEIGLDWTYEAIDCGVEDLGAVLAARADWRGFSATMPLKHALLEAAVEVRPVARAVGSANTLLQGGGGWIADNTDVTGVLAALHDHHLRPASLTVLGAGGTAQAVLAAAAELGLGECHVLVRDPARAAALLATAQRLDLEVRVESLEAGSTALGADLVVSTLPPGAADPLAAHRWHDHQALLDVVYSPWPTALAAAAGDAGATVVNGALMLLHQAAAQVELMTGRPAPLDAMRTALRTARPDSGV